MIYLIGGENTFKSRKCLEEILSGYSKKGITIKSAHISEQNEFDGALNGFGNIGLFETKQLLLIKAFDEAKKDVQEKLLTFLEELGADQEVVIYSRTKFDKRSRLFKYIKAKGKVMEFAHLKGRELENWLNELIKTHDLHLNRQILYELIIRSGEDQDILEKEVLKLKALDSEGVKIDKKVIEQVLVDTLSADVWDLVDSLSKDKTRSFMLLEHLLKTAEYEQIMGLLASQVRLLYLCALAKNRDQVISFGVHPFVASKIFSSSVKLNLTRIKKIYQKMVGIEIAVRKSKIDKRLALDLLILAF